MNGLNDTICKKRYTQVSITALGDLTTSNSRILAADPTYDMNLMVATSDFTFEEQL